MWIFVVFLLAVIGVEIFAVISTWSLRGAKFVSRVADQEP